MFFLLKMLLMLFSFWFGLLCVRRPMRIVKILAYSTRFVFDRLPVWLKPSDKLNSALSLAISNPSDFEQQYNFQLQMVKQTGYMALFVAVMGTCVIMLAN